MNKTNVMNKPVIYILLFLACLQTGFAGPVTPDQAQRVAESFFASQSRTKASGSVKARQVWHLADAKTKNDLLYAFENESSGGYVVVAGEDAISPVLGFSLSESFPAQNMPEAMRDLLDYYGNVLRMAREKNWVATSSGASFNPDGIVRLETAWWSQGDPYNRYCPVINGQRCVTGCVATAIGIIMNYHRWPERGTGELPSYSYNYKGVENTVEGHSLGHSYDWEAMNREEGRDDDQIARLLYDIGVMVEMSYTPSASGAVSSSVKRLSDYFSYDKDIREYTRNQTTDARWEQLIRNEIDARRPVLYSASDLDSGHAMVIDGYSGRYFGINFGWNGGYEAREGYSNPNKDGHWFLLTPAEGHEQDMAIYYLSQRVYCNIKPDEGSEPDWTADAYALGNLGLPFDFSVGREFVVYQIFNVNQTVQCEYVLFDEAGNIKERISSPFELNSYTSKSISCVISKQPAQGDWIAPVFFVDGYRWIPNHNRFAEFRFRKGSPQKEVLVGFFTEKGQDVTDFLMNSVRVGDPILKDMQDYLYFRCNKDFTWELLKKEAGSQERKWGSEDRTRTWPGDSYVGDGDDRYRFMTLFQEDTCYHFIHLDPGDYILRIKNPLTGESVTLSLTV
jgi:hypothetical protein